MQFQFISDLDGYFAEKYANYDKICVLKGYIMPKMQDTKRLEDGRDYSYTLPASTMRLATQKNCEDLIKQLKDGFSDTSFSFSFRPLSFWERQRDKFNKRRFKTVFPEVLKRRSVTLDEIKPRMNVDEIVWKRIENGRYYPTKNLLFSIALAAGLSDDDLNELMDVCALSYDFTEPKDVVVAYLITRGVKNPEMIKAAFQEYKIGNLFLKD